MGLRFARVTTHAAGSELPELSRKGTSASGDPQVTDEGRRAARYNGGNSSAIGANGLTRREPETACRWQRSGGWHGATANNANNARVAGGPLHAGLRALSTRVSPPHMHMKMMAESCTEVE
jgi:hypothetical protein